MRKKDFQRQKVYNWENSFFSYGPGNDYVKRMTLDECKALIKKIFRRNTPCVKDGRGTRYPRGGRWKINLPVWSRKNWIVLHECAHAKCDFNHEYDNHGPLFMRTYVELLHKHLSIPYSEIIPHARERGVKIFGWPQLYDY